MDDTKLALVVAGIGIGGTLLGIVVGAVLGIWTDRLKWKRERLAKRQEHEREALQQALKWLDPVDNAVMNVTSVIYRLARDEGDQDDLLREVPNLTGTLAKLDPLPHFQVMLPEGTYRKGLDILRGFDNLTAVVRMEDPHGQLIRMAENLQEKADAQRRELTTAYRKTFE